MDEGCSVSPCRRSPCPVAALQKWPSSMTHLPGTGEKQHSWRPRGAPARTQQRAQPKLFPNKHATLAPSPHLFRGRALALPASSPLFSHSCPEWSLPPNSLISSPPFLWGQSFSTNMSFSGCQNCLPQIGQVEPLVPQQHSVAPHCPKNIFPMASLVCVQP